jgi:hypothetical protein
VGPAARDWEAEKRERRRNRDIRAGFHPSRSIRFPRPPGLRSRYYRGTECLRLYLSVTYIVKDQ